jgi:hypothetical protein
MAQEVLQIDDGLPAATPADETPEQAGLEAALADLDARLALAARTLGAAQKQLKQAVEASRQGKVRDLPRTLAGVVESSDAFAQAALNAQRSWAFDVQGHLESGRYVAELLSQAEAAGLAGASEVDGALQSFPVIVKVDARDPSLKIGRKLDRAMRPSVIVERLRQMRGQPAREAVVRQLLASFERAYLIVSRGGEGIAVPLKSIYDALVLRPGQSREYTLNDFLLDVYWLDRSGPHVTQVGRELSFPAATGAKAGRGLQFVTETGEVRTYASIRFDAPR